MCLDCGCSETGNITIDGKPVAEGENHSNHRHPMENHHQSSLEINIKQDILQKNNHIALHNREHLAKKGVFCLNWISAPGSGKTTLLEYLIKTYGSDISFSVIEGDQQTDNDARRIRQAGVNALQINTGSACHLDAEMIHKALHQIDLDDSELLIIENIGNMVCPTAYDLGENLKTAIISCPEGEDKPVKYPDLLITSDVLLINKIDLIPYLDFDLECCTSSARKVNPQMSIFPGRP